MNDILILASLLPGPKHGYLIKKEAGLILRGSELHNNLVYPLLHRFEREVLPAPGEYGLLVAVGPGFSAELVLLQW